MTNAPDWKVEIIRTLLAKASDEPELRRPAIYAALNFRINPIPFFPSKRHEILRDFFAQEEKGSAARARFVDEVLKAPAELPKPALRRLISEICNDDELYKRALISPFFPNLPGACEICLRGVDHSRTTISRHALELLARHWPEALANGRDALIRHSTSSSRSVRASVATILGQVERIHSENLLRKLIADPERIVRRAALFSLVKVIGADSVPDLLVSLKDPAPLVRIEACQLIGRLRNDSLLEALLECSGDVSRNVRLQALKAIATIDKGLARRNFARFVREGENSFFAENMGSELLLSSTPPGNTEDTPGLIKKMLGQVETVTDDGTVYNSRAFTILTYLVLGRLLATRPFVGLGDLIIKQKSKVKDRTLKNFLNSVKRRSTHSLLDLALLLPPTLQQLEANGEKSLLFQGLFLGLLEGFNQTTQLSLADIKWCRKLTTVSDRAFVILADIFGPDPESLYWPIRPPCLPNDSDGLADLEVAMVLMANLRRWCLYRATPRCLGFLLVAGSPDWWNQIPASSSLLPASVRLIEKYGRLRSTEEIATVIGEQYWRHEFSENSPEIELLAGMGATKMRAVADFGQQGLFFKQVSTELGEYSRLALTAYENDEKN